MQSMAFKSTGQWAVQRLHRAQVKGKWRCSSLPESSESQTSPKQICSA